MLRQKREKSGTGICHVMQGKESKTCPPDSTAMSFSLGGKKNGFNRNAFMSAFTQSGIPATVADRMINRMAGYLPDWKRLISHSFLSEKMQIAYCSLLDKRREALEIL